MTRILGTKRLLRPVAAALAGVAVIFLFAASVAPHPEWRLDLTAKAPKPTIAYRGGGADVDAEEVLWLARCIYSETKRPHEQRLVAWVVRNRVQTRYRGQTSFQGVVLDPFQFSAFNPESRVRRHYMTLQPNDDAPGWERAQAIARQVYTADGSRRPFSIETRHFYSERSMEGRHAPAWSSGMRPVKPVGFRVDPLRFRFFAHVEKATTIG